MSIKLKPCPFSVCGSEVTSKDVFARNSLKGDGSLGYSVKCPKCHSYGPVRNSGGAAVADWNHRSV